MDYSEFYDTHSRDVYFFLLRSLRDAGVAEDLTQEVFLNYYRHYWNDRAVENPRALLLSMARNAVRNHAGSATSRRVEARDDLEHVANGRHDPSEDREVQELMDELLSFLPAEEREVLLLRYDQNLTLADVGSVLGITETAALRRIEKAERALLALCRERGIRAEDYL